MSTAVASDLWWKNAIFYCLDVETFADSGGDGVGDLPGLIEHIDHLAGLGVTCLWLMPFQPSPNLDDGYDIIDHYGVGDRFGSLGDVVVLLRAAKDRGLRVIMDLVVNHTSDRHPWFRSARADPDSPFRDHYVWRDEPGPEPANAVVFPDAEDSIWSWDDRAGQYYLHHFYSHQPELDIANPTVRDEISKIAGFWLALGVDGFRVDAVPYLLETGDGGSPELDPHRLLRELRAFVNRRRGDAVMLGEINLPPDELVPYFGEHPGDEMHLVFDFPVMQATHLSLARCDATPLADALRTTPSIPEGCQWATFLRNHDELTLDQLDDDERQEVFDAFGPEERMQLFGRGLRRRLPAMFDGDEQRLRMAYSLLLSLRGTPVMFYGEEIGMGENLDIPGRLSVRTPMQWTSGPNGGFSTAPKRRLARPLPDGRFGPLAVNVEDQRRDPGSFLRWMERMLRLRRETSEIGCGTYEVLGIRPTSVLGCVATHEERSVLVLHNLSPQPAEVRLRLDAVRALDLIDRHDVHAGADGELEIVLGPYDHRWYRLQGS
jgi:trehalose synthase